MSQVLNIHAENPQLRLIRQAVNIIKAGGIVIYPTDSAYAFGCRIGNKSALQTISKIRQFDSDHNFTLVCRDLSEIALYARVDNSAYRLLKAYTPGSYTFILRATSEVPRLLMHPKRKTIGIRIPDHPVVVSLLSELNEPILSSTLIMPGEDNPPYEIDDIKDDLGHTVDLIIDSGYCGLEVTTVVDLVAGRPRLLRAGKANTEPFQN